jgi:predicted Zn finger-like uncharacterized protein
MDVRCERCRAQYVFDDEQVTPQGLTVQCTNCGHVFRVKKKELVVTVPVRPEDVTEQPFMATAASLRPPGFTEASALRPPGFTGASAPRPPPAAPPHGWTIRQVGGGTLAFTELTTLQKWIVERKVTREDQVSQGDDAWVRLGAIGELQAFFAVVDDAERGRRAPPVRPGGTDFYPPPPFPLPSFEPPPAAVRPAPAAAPAPARPTARSQAPATLTSELDAEELAAVRGHRGGRPRFAVVALLLVTVGAVAYVFAPAYLRQEPLPTPALPALAPPPAPPPVVRPAPEPVGVPLNLELKAPPPEQPRTEPPPEVRPASPPTARAPESTPSPTPAPPRAGGPKALLQQAEALRNNKAGGRGDTTRALDLYGQVLATEPDNVMALTGRGLCYFELGTYAPAEASFQRALQLERDVPEAIMGLAETYRSQGRNAEALPLYERYLAEHPDGDEAAVARYAIGKLKE